MLSGSCAHTHQSLLGSLWPGLPPISVWKPEIAVPHRNPGGKAARAAQARVATSASTRSNLRMGVSPNTPPGARTQKKRQTCPPEFELRNSAYLTVTGGSTRPSVEHPPERHDEDDAGSPRGAQVEAPCPPVTCPPPLLRERAVARRPHGQKVLRDEVAGTDGGEPHVTHQLVEVRDDPGTEEEPSAPRWHDLGRPASNPLDLSVHVLDARDAKPAEEPVGEPVRRHLRRQLAGGRGVVADESEARDPGRQNEPVEVKAVLTLDLATDGFLEKRHRLREAGREDHHVGVEHLAVGKLDRVAAAESLNDRFLGPDPSAPDERVRLRPDADALEVARQGRFRDQGPGDAGLPAQEVRDARPHEPHEWSS